MASVENNGCFLECSGLSNLSSELAFSHTEQSSRQCYGQPVDKDHLMENVKVNFFSQAFLFSEALLKEPFHEKTCLRSFDQIRHKLVCAATEAR